MYRYNCKGVSGTFLPPLLTFNLILKILSNLQNLLPPCGSSSRETPRGRELPKRLPSTTMASLFARVPVAANQAVQAAARGKFNKSMRRWGDKGMSQKKGSLQYHKGKGVPAEGKVNSRGRFVVDWRKRVNLLVPDLKGFSLKAYVDPMTPKV